MLDGGHAAIFSADGAKLVADWIASISPKMRSSLWQDAGKATRHVTRADHARHAGAVYNSDLRTNERLASFNKVR